KSVFAWKYPFWYCKNVKVTDCTWEEMGRAGVWYTDNMLVKDSIIEAPKNFRRCNGLELVNVDFKLAEETLWSCNNIKMTNVSAEGNYFAMNSSNIEVDGFTLDGNYSFDGCKNVKVSNSKLISKDAFWNAENVTVVNTYISGEYLGWNSKNLTFIDCTIESLQGLCYIDNLVMKNCKLVNTNLAFEYCSDIEAKIDGKVDSVFNPISGVIEADEIEELIVEKDLVDPSKTRIVSAKINKRSDKPDWK
ncbi:MAG: DUF3737 family protein, partial [Lachnospiraceae bacterium]|nr:DUF3737 family protein [Lachnospiraceae bacterium]